MNNRLQGGSHSQSSECQSIGGRVAVRFPPGTAAPLPCSVGTWSRNHHILPPSQGVRLLSMAEGPCKITGNKTSALFRLHVMSCSFLRRGSLPPLELYFSFMLGFGSRNQFQNIRAPFHRKESGVSILAARSSGVTFPYSCCSHSALHIYSAARLCCKKHPLG